MANSAPHMAGLLIIGDPHLEGRQPGFRKDDYPRVILEKVEWCLDYARQNRLLPVILGDVFDKPRDNPTWLLTRLVELLRGIECIGVYGNHDCANPRLDENDSLMLLVEAGCIRLVDEQGPWRGVMNGRPVIIGGSSYRHPIPGRFEPGGDGEPLVLWLAHHDITVPGYEDQGRIRPREIDQIDMVLNGHIHRQLEPVQAGATRWLTPGNISRRSRHEANRDHVPAVLRIDVTAGEPDLQCITVPHARFEDVFHDAIVDDEVDSSESAFIAGLAELQARRTESGAGLLEFLERNLEPLEPAVADEIRTLAREVIANGAGEKDGAGERRTRSADDRAAAEAV